MAQDLLNDPQTLAEKLLQRLTKAVGCLKKCFGSCSLRFTPF